MTSQDCDLGLIGLGVMGRNFLLNLADHGFAVAGYDLDGDKVDQLQKEASAGHVIRPAGDMEYLHRCAQDAPVGHAAGACRRPGGCGD